MALNDGIHANSSDGENHRVTNFTWSNAITRASNNGLGYTLTDLYKEGVQTDTIPPTFWRIDSVDAYGVATFQAVGDKAQALRNEHKII